MLKKNSHTIIDVGFSSTYFAVYSNSFVCLFRLRIYVPVNKFSIMWGRNILIVSFYICVTDFMIISTKEHKLRIIGLHSLFINWLNLSVFE